MATVIRNSTSPCPCRSSQRSSSELAEGVQFRGPHPADPEQAARYVVMKLEESQVLCTAVISPGRHFTSTLRLSGFALVRQERLPIARFTGRIVRLAAVDLGPVRSADTPQTPTLNQDCPDPPSWHHRPP